MEDGYSWHIAVVFTFGETAGSGLVALPNAMVSLGFLGGIVTLVLMCLIPFYTATLLGNNWIIMRTRWSEYTEHCRNPYPEMAQKALGVGMGHFTSFCTFLTLYGGGAVFSLLAARTLSEVLNGLGVGATMCSTLMAVGVILWPFVMLKSPMHFWQVSIVAAVSTLTAVVLILLGYFLDARGCNEHAVYPEFTPSAASSSLATIIFAYGGHPCLPTIVHDMKTPQHFFRCFLLSYIALFLLYTPVSLLGFWIYGDSVTDSVISSIQNDTLRRAISVLIAIHVFFSILIIVNPLLQASEHFVRVKQEFGVGRFVVRSLLFWAIIFSAASVPNFGIVVNLVGGSTLPLLVLIFPPMFAACLEVRQKLEEDGAKEDFSIRSIWKYHPKPRLLLDVLIIALGFYVLFHSTFHSIHSLFFSPNPPTRSCFSTWLSTSSETSSLLNSSSSHSTHFQCCGAFRNVSLSETRSCF